LFAGGCWWWVVVRKVSGWWWVVLLRHDAVSYHAHGHGLGLVALECDLGDHVEERWVLDLIAEPVELVGESPAVLGQKLHVLWYTTSALD
jgi:hypothetical protein